VRRADLATDGPEILGASTFGKPQGLPRSLQGRLDLYFFKSSIIMNPSAEKEVYQIGLLHDCYRPVEM